MSGTVLQVQCIQLGGTRDGGLQAAGGAPIVRTGRVRAARPPLLSPVAQVRAAIQRAMSAPVFV